MSVDDGKHEGWLMAAEIPVTERYRAVILAVGGVAMSALLVVSEALAAGRPWGGVELVTLLVAVATAVGVYFPANPWTKFAAGLAGATGQTLVAAATDNRVTTAELVVITIAVLSALGVGAFPNAPALVVGEVGDDVPDAGATGTTYLPPSQRDHL
jgi:hypothetical protein